MDQTAHDIVYTSRDSAMSMGRHESDYDVIRCDACGQTFDSRQKLGVHQATHSQQARKHVCAKCGAGFKTSSRLQRHLLKHSDVKPHKCSHCDQRYTQKENLQRHERRQHRHLDTEVYLYCKFCPSKFCLPKQLVNHLKKEHPQTLQPTAGKRRSTQKASTKTTTQPSADCDVQSALIKNNTGSYVSSTCNLSSEANILLKNSVDYQKALTVTSGRLHSHLQVNEPVQNTPATLHTHLQMNGLIQNSFTGTLTGRSARQDIATDSFTSTTNRFQYSNVEMTSQTGLFRNQSETQSTTENSSSETSNLSHSSDAIMKYLVQTSPSKLPIHSAKLPVTTTSSNPVNVCVQKVQIQSNGPLLGSRITPSPVSVTGDKVLDEGCLSGSVHSSGLTVTPYRVQKSANNHMLPIEYGFSLSGRKTYSLNFTPLPDMQLPENFMEDSMDNSNDCSVSSRSAASNNVMSGDKTESGDKDGERIASVNRTTENEHSVECDVITIDSDSNISARLQNDGDSDIEIVEVNSDSISHRGSRQSMVACRDVSSDNSQNSPRSDSVRSRPKRKHSDLSEGVMTPSKPSEISIVMYQAASPVKIAKVTKNDRLVSENYHCVGQDRGNFQQNNEDLNRIDIQPPEDQSYKKTHQNRPEYVKASSEELSQPDRVELRNNDLQVLDLTTSAIQESPSAVVAEYCDKVACLNEPPLITIFPSGESTADDCRDVVSNCSKSGVDRDSDGAKVDNHSVNCQSNFTGISSPVLCNENPPGITVKLLDTCPTSFSNKFSHLSPIREFKPDNLIHFPKLAPKLNSLIKSSTGSIGNISDGENESSNSVKKYADEHVGHTTTIGGDPLHSVLSKRREQYAISENTTLHTKCLENAIAEGPSGNIFVKEVTLDKNGPSLFGKITEKKHTETSHSSDGHKTVLVIETGLDSKSPAKTVVSSLNETKPRETEGKMAEYLCNSVKLSDSEKEKDQDSLKNIASTREENVSGYSGNRSKNDCVGDIRNQYKTKESRRKLWGLVQPPCANELLRAKRENLTLDDIYEEKITKLLEKIGLNTFQGIPISQFFANEGNVPKGKAPHLWKNKESKTTPNSEELMAKIAQKTLHQEQVKVKVQALMELLEKRKLFKHYVEKASGGGHMSTPHENTGQVKVSSGSGSRIVSNHLGEGENRKPDTEESSSKVHKVDVSNCIIVSNSKVIGSRVPTMEQLTANKKLPVVSLATADKLQLRKVVLTKSHPVGQLPMKAFTVASNMACDGVFKIPTRCAPSPHNSARAVKVILKNTKPVIASLTPQQQIQPEVAIRQAVGPAVTISNTIYRPLLPNVSKSRSVGVVHGKNLSFTQQTQEDGFSSVSSSVLLQPLSVLTSEASPTKEQPFGTYAKSSASEWASPGKLAWSSSVFSNNAVMTSLGQTSNQKDDSVVTQIHHSPRSSVKVIKFPLSKDDTNVRESMNAFDVEMVENPSLTPTNITSSSVHQMINDQSITTLPNQLHRNPAISPTGSSQNSLPDVDFMLMSSGSPCKHQILSPMKLISGDLTHSPVSPVKDTSPSKDGSLLTLHDIHPSELQALMSSPIKSFELENSNLSTASQTELLETLQNFLRDIPNSVSPQPHGGSTSPIKLYSGKGGGNDSQSSSDHTNSAIILSTLFDTSPNKDNSKDISRVGGKSKFFKHVEPSVSISQPSCNGGDIMYTFSPSDNTSSGETKTVPLSVGVRCSSVSSDSQLSPTASLDLSSCLTTDEEFPDKNGLKEELDCTYVRKKLVVNAPELYDENTMDPIAS